MTNCMKALRLSICLIGILLIAIPGFSTNPRMINQNHPFITAVNNLKIVAGDDLVIKMDEVYATPFLVLGKLATCKTPSIESVDRFLSENKVLFKINNPIQELSLEKVEADDMGFKHIKMQRFHNGIPIYGSELVAHYDKEGTLYCVNGRYHPSIEMNTTPVLNSKRAVDISVDDILNNSVLAIDQDPTFYLSMNSKNELVIYPMNGTYYLAFKIDTPLYFDELGAYEWRYFIDAQTGNILNKYNNLKTDGPIMSYAPDMWNTQRTLNTYQFNGKYYMIDGTRAMFDSINTQVPYNSKGVIITVDYRNGEYPSPYYYLTTPNNQNWDKIAVSLHCNLGETYAFYKSTFNRNSFDNNGESIRAHVHYKKNYPNAFWTDSLQGLFFGDGDNIACTYLAGGQDVITHEFTHGVTSYTSNLEYQFQSGALNESFSDMIACVHDSDDWLLGEDVWTPKIAGDALRSLENPNLYDQPKTMSEYHYLNSDQDNGGVHVNSGIPNYTFYLLATDIGRSKAGQISFRAFTLYLTSKSQFIDARDGMVQAATDLYGKDSNEVNAVMNAFQEVGIGSGSAPKQDCVGIDELEKNDSINDSQKISGSNPLIVCGEISLGGNDGNSYTGDYDWYEIDAPATGLMKASLNWTNQQADLDFYLMDIGVNKLTGAAGATNSEPENFQFLIEKGKKYYILVVSWQDKDKYKLTVNLPESTEWNCNGIQERTEPNDDYFTDVKGNGILTVCAEISSGGYNYDTGHYTGDWDWYYYTLTSTGVTMFILDWDSDADVDFSVADKDGNLISGILGMTLNKPEKVTLNLTPGDYMIAVVSANKAAKYSLTIKQPGFTTGEGCQGFWETEPNDNVSQAQDVSGLSPINICGNFDMPGDGVTFGNMDVYKFVPDNSGDATIRMFWNSGWDFEFLVLRLYPTQYEIIGMGESTVEDQGQIRVLKASVVKGGQYYIGAAPWLGGSDYSIRIDLTNNEQACLSEKEPNNNLAQAQLIVGISPIEICGNITSFQATSEIDLFKTKVIPDPGELMYGQIFWTGAGNLDVYVIDVDGSNISFVSGTTGATKDMPENFFVELNPGKVYYIGLICWDGPANYTMHIGFPFGY
jgi:bacillolysin